MKTKKSETRSVMSRHVQFYKDQFHIKQDILDQKIKVEK